MGQSRKAWFDRLPKAVKAFGYTQCQTDHTTFIKFSPAGNRAILIVSVDDIILTGDDCDEIHKLKDFLAK